MKLRYFVVTALIAAGAAIPATATTAAAKSQRGCAPGSFCVWDQKDGKGQGTYLSHENGWQDLPSYLDFTVNSMWNRSSCMGVLHFRDGHTNSVPAGWKGNQHNHPVVTM